MGSDGETHLPLSQTHSLPDCVVITETLKRLYSERRPQLLRVLPVLMRCESGTEMKQVERRWIRGTDRERERGRGLTINLIAGKSIGKGRVREEDGERRFGGGQQSESW